MDINKNNTIPKKWMDSLDLLRRKSPELYLPDDSVIGSAHSNAIRDSFQKIGLSAIFCVQGVPAFAYLFQEKYDSQAVIDAHAKLWNQGLVSLLLVISDETIRIFSLAKLPIYNVESEFQDKCLIDTFNRVEEALKISSLVSGAETGRLWQEHSDFFKLNERVDSYLLNNLVQSHKELKANGLESEAAQALLMQTMFIAYLEDRGIINKAYFQARFEKITSSYEIFSSGNISNLEKLFESLSLDFNGNVFVSPCSFETQEFQQVLTAEHLNILARFRCGTIEMESGQGHFWGYNFEYIPVELISAVYDRFLGEKEAERKNNGAYYTPMFLADSVMAQVWDSIPYDSKNTGMFLDPACGSGVFLVRTFQLLCEQLKLENNIDSLEWEDICIVLKRVHGWDINGSAIRVAIFSLYIAMLEQVSLPSIKKLIKKGKILPSLWGKSLIQQDFFVANSEKAKYEVIVGNPPWSSRHGLSRNSSHWCSENNCQMPGNEDAWAFTWKAISHLKENGLAAYLVPAMGFLHNPQSFQARSELVQNTKVSRIINFSDLRFQLFGDAISPAALIVFGEKTELYQPYQIEYWTPKADKNLQIKRNITITNSDKLLVNSNEVMKDEFSLKRRLWMRSVDSKLFNYLASFSRLGDHIVSYTKSKNQPGKWKIGQGFQPFNNGRSAKVPHISNEVEKHPYIPVKELDKIYQGTIEGGPWQSTEFRRKGFEESYGQSKILVSRGVGTSMMRLQAAYCPQASTFQHILNAIIFPKKDENKAKVLTAYLNSKLAIWFAFHGTASFGSSRPEVSQIELLKLPFPFLVEQGCDKNGIVEKEIITLMESYRKTNSELFKPTDYVESTLLKLDVLIYKYFGLSEEEIKVIEDTVEYIIPASQPHQNTFPQLWAATNFNQREKYSHRLVQELRHWLEPNCDVSIELKGKNQDFALLEISLINSHMKSDISYCENNSDMKSLIDNIVNSAKYELPGNFNLIPDLKIFIENKLYLIKPLQLSHWMESSAIEDANSISLELQTYIAPLDEEDATCL